MTSTLTSPTPLPLRLVTGDASKQAEFSLATLTHDMGTGSDAAWREFHLRYYLVLLRYAASRVACSEDAGEIVQLAYLRIARHIKPFSDETELWRWLACVVRCVAVDHQRGVLRRALLLEKFAHWREVQKSTAVKLPDAHVAGSLAHEALMKLPTDDAQLLRLKYYEGWSVDELAADAGTTPKTIENRLARLRQRLRDILLRIQ